MIIFKPTAKTMRNIRRTDVAIVPGMRNEHALEFAVRNSATMTKFGTIFPQSEVVTALEEWWEAEICETELPADPEAPVDVMKPLVEIDSHRAVRVLITVEEVLGQGHIPESIIKSGGYVDFDELKADLLPKLEAYFDKKKGKAYA